MSINGASFDLISYGINSTLLVIAGLFFFWRGGGFSGKALCLGLAFSLFIAFKAAFVRHDFHATIAADFVLLVSFFVATSLPHSVAAIIIASSIAVWCPTTTHYLGRYYENPITVVENSWIRDICGKD